MESPALSTIARLAVLAAVVGGCAALPGDTRPGREFRDCPACPTMVVIPPGRFTMGSPAVSAGSAGTRTETANETPAHDVEFATAFALGKYEVTRKEYAAFVAATGYTDTGGCLQIGRAMVTVASQDSSWQNPGYPQTDNGPALCIGYNDAQAYVAWLSAATGYRYALPTEAQWEYAARAGSTAPAPWGEDGQSASACTLLNGRDRNWDPGKPADNVQPIFACDDGHEGPADVGSYPPNAWGLFDMIGNASEWTADCNHPTYAGAPADGRAWTTDSNCVFRVIRGGSFRNGPNLNRYAARLDRPMSGRAPVLGLRVARSLDRTATAPAPAPAASLQAITVAGAAPEDQALFRTRCAGCHVDAASFRGDRGRDRQALTKIIRDGVEGSRGMPAWRDVLTEDEIGRLAEYVRKAAGWQ